MLLDMEKYPVSFWNYVETGALGKEEVAKWKELGVNLAMSFEYDPKKHKKEQMTEMLDECARLGLKVVVCDARSHWNALKEQGRDAFIEGLKQAVEDFGSHKAVWGFHVGDEPHKGVWEEAIEAVRLQKSLAPRLHPFVNFFAMWRGDSFAETLGFEQARFGEKLEDFVRRSGLEFLMYDCYMQLVDHNRLMALNDYFINLNLFGAVAKRCGVPLWNTIGCFGGCGNRVPTEDDLRWQLNTSIAHGVKGISWFYFYERRYHLMENFRGSPIDLYNRKTPMYDMVMRQTNIFNDHFAAVVNGYDAEKVYHFGVTFGNTEMFLEGADDIVRQVESMNDTPLIVTRFLHPQTGKRIIGVCNLSQTQPEKAKLYFYGKYKKFDGISMFMSPGQIHFVKIDE